MPLLKLPHTLDSEVHVSVAHVVPIGGMQCPGVPLHPVGQDETPGLVPPPPLPAETPVSSPLPLPEYTDCPNELVPTYDPVGLLV